MLAFRCGNRLSRVASHDRAWVGGHLLVLRGANERHEGRKKLQTGPFLGVYPQRAAQPRPCKSGFAC